MNHYNNAHKLACKISSCTPEIVGMIERQLEIAYIDGRLEQAEIEKNRLIEERKNIKAKLEAVK